MAMESSLRDIRVTKLTKATYSRWKRSVTLLRAIKFGNTTGKTTKPCEVRTVINVKEIDDWRVKDSKASVIR